jgi:metal-responsive CopG/Arc/MetJ family transcriptional regulator
MAWDRERGATTPKKERQVTVRLTQGMGEALAARAAREGADRSEVVRQALAHALGLDADGHRPVGG